jgi:hypothetical protein
MQASIGMEEGFPENLKSGCWNSLRAAYVRSLIVKLARGGLAGFAAFAIAPGRFGAWSRHLVA